MNEIYTLISYPVHLYYLSIINTDIPLYVGYNKDPQTFIDELYPHIYDTYSRTTSLEYRNKHLRRLLEEGLLVQLNSIAIVPVENIDVVKNYLIRNLMENDYYLLNKRAKKIDDITFKVDWTPPVVYVPDLNKAGVQEAIAKHYIKHYQNYPIENYFKNNIDK